VESPPINPRDFPNVLRLTGTPVSAEDPGPSAFSDQGAWHMFALRDAAPGGFVGPLLLIDGGRWLGRSLVSVAVEVDGESAPVVWSRPPGASVPAYYPGRLHDFLIGPHGLQVELDLVFATDRTAVVRARMRNWGERTLSVRPGWRGDAAFTGRAITAATD
jgi:putative isomerase